MKKCIINGDDFGLSHGVNKGILDGFQEGILTSTTLMVNLPAFENAVMIAKDHPGMTVGIHLTLLWGKPVSRPDSVRSLTCRNGLFPRSLTVLARRHFLHMLSTEEIKTEFRNQIQKFLDSGLTPTHIDTHKHIHSLPSIMTALIDTAREFKITRLRYPLEQPLDTETNDLKSNNYKPSFKAVCKRNIINYLFKMNSSLILNSGMQYPDYFIGIDYMDKFDSDTLTTVLGRLRDGVTEIMCHPGYIDDEALMYSRVPPHRDRELKAIRDMKIREFIREHNIHLMSYKEL